MNTNIDEKIFSEIPLKTFRWLGVNESTTEAEIKISEQMIKADEKCKFILTNLDDETFAKKFHFNVDQGGSLEIICVDVAEADSFCEIVVDLDGDNSSAELIAAYFGDGDRKVDMNYIIRHKGKKTDATMDVKGALSGKCDKIFRGTLDFLQGSSGSVGREREEVIILSNNVRNRSVPLMLSHEDDVDGHHAVTIGRIDEEKLFYLMSRGLDQIEAEKLIIEASFNPVIEKIDDENLKNEIFAVIESRLANVK